MPLTRRGWVDDPDAELGARDWRTLPWVADTEAALERDRGRHPSADDLRRIDAYRVAPAEYLDNPHFRMRMLESELAHMLRTWLGALTEVLDEETACKVAHAVGMTHGKRRLGTFLKGQGLPGGAESMAMWQDTAHAGAGVKHTSALFARYDDELVEVRRTEDSFGSHEGKPPPASDAFFDGFVDGYMTTDPKLASVEELKRRLPDGGVEFIHRFRYRRAR